MCYCLDGGKVHFEQRELGTANTMEREALERSIDRLPKIAQGLFPFLVLLRCASVVLKESVSSQTVQGFVFQVATFQRFVT